MKDLLSMSKILDEIEKNRISNINLIASIGSTILFIYAIINLFMQDFPAAIFEFICGLLIIFAIYLVNKKHKVNLGIELGTMVIFVLAIHNFYSGGFDSTGILWVFVLVCTILLLNGKDSLLWVFSLSVILSGIFVLKLMGILTLPYDDFFVIMFFISYILISIIVYTFIMKVEKGLNQLKDAFENLEETNLKLKFKETVAENSMKALEAHQLLQEKLTKASK